MKAINEGAREQDFMTTRQAAELLGVSLRTVQLWVEDGVLFAWKTAGGHRRVTHASVDRLLQQRTKSIEATSYEKILTIVVVEDDPLLLDLYQLHLTAMSLPIRVVCATNGFEGLIKIGECHPDLVITDLVMPDMDGFAMARALRDHEELKETQLLVVSMLDDSEIREQGGLPEGAMVLRKPIPFDRIESILRTKAGALQIH